MLPLPQSFFADRKLKIVKLLQKIRAASIGQYQVFLTRYLSMLAAVLCAYENLEAEFISLDHIERAIQIVSYYTEEMLRLHNASLVSRDLLETGKLLKWLKEDYKEEYVTVRAGVQFAKGVSREKANIERLGNILVAHNQLIPVENVMVQGHEARKAWKIQGKGAAANAAPF